MSLRTLEFRQHPDADGVLRLQVPVAAINQRHRVIVLVEPETEAESLRPWPEGFIESTCGQWQGELDRGPQGEFERRDSL